MQDLIPIQCQPPRAAAAGPMCRRHYGYHLPGCQGPRTLFHPGCDFLREGRRESHRLQAAAAARPL